MDLLGVREKGEDTDLDKCLGERFVVKHGVFMEHCFFGVMSADRESRCWMAGHADRKRARFCHCGHPCLSQHATVVTLVMPSELSTDFGMLDDFLVPDWDRSLEILRDCVALLRKAVSNTVGIEASKFGMR